MEINYEVETVNVSCVYVCVLKCFMLYFAQFPTLSRVISDFISPKPLLFCLFLVNITFAVAEVVLGI